MKIKAHVPTQQYGFIEISGEPSEKAEIERLYNHYAEKPIIFKSDSNEGFKRIETFTGETVLYNDDLHEYRDLQGNVLLGGSTYAQQFSKPFDAEALLPKCANAWGVEESAIADIWDMNRDTSNHFGTAIHNALESAHRNWKTGETIKGKKKGATENYSLPKSPVIRKAVVAFTKEYGTDALPEVFVSDVSKGRAGQIDRLVVDESKKTCRVQDFKTSAQDKDTTLTYQHQLSFYASMLKGWTVEGLDIFYWDGDNWTKKTLKVLEVK
jgi:hypothetical protein